MNKGVIAYSLALALLGAPLVAWAGANPDFDDDAKPILREQPGLINYVKSHFEVKDTGTAKFPGDDDRRPEPPYIFRARPLGSYGPFNLRLLIQPGPPGHILGVVDITKVHLQQPGAAPAPVPQQPPSYAQQPAPDYQSPTLSQGEVKPLPPENASPPAQQQPAPQQPSEPTADTPSGPIMAPPSDSSSSPSSQPSLAPPPDPAPSGSGQ